MRRSGNVGNVEVPIEAQSKVDALAALALLQADVSRWQVPWPHVAKAWADLATLTDSVNKE